MKRILHALIFCGALNAAVHAQWIQMNGPLGGFVSSFAVSGSNLFAGTSGGVFLSTNNGSSWTAVKAGLTNSDVRALATSGSNLFAGTIGGVFLSTNSGSSWTAINTGLANYNVYALAISGSNLFTGNDGGGVWRRPLSEIITSVYDAGNRLPTVFRLEYNYPNPFNPRTTIRYELPTHIFVRLNVYDTAGRLVRLIVNEFQPAGSHRVEFDGTGLSSGVYFYRLETDGRSLVQKMVLMQ